MSKKNSPPPETVPPAGDQGTAGARVKVRVLVATLIAGERRQPDDVVELDAAEAEALAAAYAADPHPDAVAYAESLKAEEA